MTTETMMHAFERAVDRTAAHYSPSTMNVVQGFLKRLRVELGTEIDAELQRPPPPTLPSTDQGDYIKREIG